MGRVTIIRGLSIVAIAIIAFSLAACSTPQSPKPEIALIGTITDTYTGKPVPAAVVKLGANQLTTDANGRYQTAQWDIKDSIQVIANGYETVSMTLSLQPQLATPAPPSVTLDAKIRPNILSGIITSTYSGKPLAGALVRAGTAISATTGVDGRYSLSEVPESLTLTVSAPDHEVVNKSLKQTTSFDAGLRPNTLSGVITDRFTGSPVPGVTVKAGDVKATTSADGRYKIVGAPERATVSFTAPGYAELTQSAERTVSLDAVLRPDVLQAKLVDGNSGAPVAHATIIATANLNSSDVAYTRIDKSTDGSFILNGIPEQGYIQVLAPGYRKEIIELRPGSIPAVIKLEPFGARAIYITAAMASSMKRVNQYFDLIDRTELNAIVIDLKSDLRDDLGLIYYDSQVPIVKELNTARDIMDIKAILAEAKKRGIYTIARVHIFSHDNVLADAKPEWAAKDRINGGVFADYPTPTIRYAWMDPWNQNVWDYNIQLSVEASLMGFDEINYDYIRFPSLEFSASDKDRLLLSRTDDTPEDRYANIGAVLERSQRAINGAGAFLSVDVFGYSTWGPASLIGQNLQVMAQHADYICPMVYPSHYGPGTLNFDNPSNHPYEIVLDSLQRGVKQIGDRRAQQRPWLQDFTLIWVPKDRIVEYGPVEVRAQIKAVEDYRKEAGWILYDSDNRYTEEALKPAK